MTRVYRRIGWSPAPLARTVHKGETLIIGIWDVSDAILARMRSKDTEVRSKAA